MDFQASIQKEAQLNALLQKDISFERARQLAFMGRQKEAMEEIVTRIQNAVDINKLLPYEMAALADATGLSAENLRIMVQNQENLNKITDKTKSN